MAKRKHNEFVAGIFSILALAAGVGVVLWLGVVEPFARPRARAVFFAEAGTVSPGLDEGSPVKIGDAVIGRIESIRYDAARGGSLYLARIDQPGISIHKDGKAIGLTGMVGAGVLVITDPGSPQEPLADEDNPITIDVVGVNKFLADAKGIVSMIKAQLDTSDSKAIVARLQDVLGKLQAQLDAGEEGSLVATALRIARSLEETADEIRRQVNPKDDKSLLATSLRIAAKLEATASEIRAQVDPKNPKSLMAGAKRSVTTIEQTTTKVAAMVEKVRPDLEATVAKARQYTEQDFARIIKKLDGVMTRLEDIAKKFQTVAKTSEDLIVLNRNRIEDILANLRLMSLNLKAMSKEIRRRPWLILHTPSEKETRDQNIYDAVRAFGEAAAQLEDALEHLKALYAAHPEGLGPQDARLKDVRAQLDAAFENFQKVEDRLFKEVAGQRLFPPATQPKP